MTLPAGDIKQSRLDFIQQIMDRQQLKGDPRRHVVLHGWNKIIDWDRDYELTFPDLPPPPFLVGREVWVMARSDSPDLVRASVIEDGPDGPFVKPENGASSFLVTRDDVKQTPIPLRPFAIRRSALKDYIGEALFAEWSANRVRRFLEAARGG